MATHEELSDVFKSIFGMPLDDTFKLPLGLSDKERGELEYTALTLGLPCPTCLTALGLRIVHKP